MKLKDVSILFDEEVLLNSISMRIPKGKLIAVTGPSGCGKTYLIRNLAKCIGKPYLEIDAKSITNEGFSSVF